MKAASDKRFGVAFGERNGEDGTSKSSDVAAPLSLLYPKRRELSAGAFKKEGRFFGK